MPPIRFSFCLRRCLTIAFLLTTCIAFSSAHATSCKVATAYEPSEADQAFLQSDYDRAVTLYQAGLLEKPGDPALTASLALTFLRQQKIKEADDLVQKALTQNPKSAILLTSLGEIQYREGTPWLAGATASEAMQLDPCYPQLHLLRAPAPPPQLSIRLRRKGDRHRPLARSPRSENPSKLARNPPYQRTRRRA